MPLISFNSMLQAARRGGYAVGGFNACNAEGAQAVITQALENRSPILLISSPAECKLLGVDVTAKIISALASFYKVPVCLHLDHAKSYEDVVAAINAGFKSVMIDGSTLSFKENISLTKRVVDYAKPLGISVEAELGAVGRVDDITIESAADSTNVFTCPEEAEQFVLETGCDALAVSIGNAHGLYSKAPELKLDLLEEISKRVNIPLVLHGGSGTPVDQLKSAIALGIAKVNVASDIAKAYNDHYLPAISQKKLWWSVAKRESTLATKPVISHWMDILGCNGHL